MSGPLRVDRVSLAQLRDDWSALDGDGGIFGTWEWADAWWRHFGRGHELALHACRSRDGRLEAVLPLYLRRAGPIRVLRFLGHGPGDELGPVHAPGASDAAASALLGAIANLDWNVFLAEQLPGDKSWPARLGGRRWRREACPVLAIPEGGWDAFLAGRSSNFREQLRRRLRALERSGDVAFRLADATSLERDLNALFALHRARWQGRRTDFADTPFHRELARAAVARGWLRLWLLEIDARPIAAWHGFHVGRIASYYQAGRDPAFDRFSPGFLLLARSLRAAIEEGAAEYRFGRGAEAFKYRFTDDDPGLVSVVVVRGVRGRAALAAARAARKLRR